MRGKDIAPDCGGERKSKWDRFTKIGCLAFFAAVFSGAITFKIFPPTTSALTSFYNGNPVPLFFQAAPWSVIDNHKIIKEELPKVAAYSTQEATAKITSIEHKFRIHTIMDDPLSNRDALNNFRFGLELIAVNPSLYKIRKEFNKTAAEYFVSLPKKNTISASISKVSHRQLSKVMVLDVIGFIIFWAIGFFVVEGFFNLLDHIIWLSIGLKKQYLGYIHNLKRRLNTKTNDQSLPADT